MTPDRIRVEWSKENAESLAAELRALVAERDQLREERNAERKNVVAAWLAARRYRAALEAVAHAEKDVPGSVAGMIANRALRGDPTEAPEPKLRRWPALEGGPHHDPWSDHVGEVRG